MKKAQWLLSMVLVLTLANCESGDSSDEKQDTQEVQENQNSSNSLPSSIEVSSKLASIIKKTGQSKSYDDMGNEILDETIKDDGYYQKGVEHLYRRKGDTVIDDTTGLMWQDNEEARDTIKPWLTMENYKRNNYDNTTGDTAISYCNNLNLDGYSDWRLPTVRELHSIMNNGQYSTEFENIALHCHWSSTSHNAIAWGVWFQGEISNNRKFYKRYVRCVRNKE